MKNQPLQTKIKSLLIAGFVFAFFFVFLPKTEASHCPGYPFTLKGAAFENYQNIEYVNNLLVIHLKLALSVTDGRFWFTNFNFLNDECVNASVNSFGKAVFISPGTQFFSIRFSSPTHFDIWNDETNSIETCLNCSQDIPLFPSYEEIFISGVLNNGQDSFTTEPRTILFNAPGPPVKNDTLSRPPSCPPFFAQGFLFDDYERAEYANGLLAYHFRLKSPLNDGRSFPLNANFYDESCIFIERAVANPVSVSITPFVRYYSIRFSSPTHFDIWNDETNSIETCLNCSQDIPATISDGSPISYFSFSSVIPGETSFFSTPFPIEEISAKPDPVIIIPGILGSADKNGEWVIDPIFHTYDDLIATLEANGYTEGVDLFTMPYDWRRSNVLTALQLKHTIDEVEAICGCSKVDLVAHSMGGLVARQYIQSENYEDDVDQLIFLGTPHLGAPDSYLMWEGGDFGPRLRDSAFEFFYEKEAKKFGFESLFDYIKNRPISSIQELLPIYDYIFENNNLRNYPNNYPQNVFLKNLMDSRDVLLNSGVKISSIIGDTGFDSTSISFDVNASTELPLWEHGKPINTNFGFGDGTVPFSSASNINNDLIVSTSSHRGLLTNTEDIVFKKLTGKDASVLITNNTDSFLDINFRLLLVKILSPIDVLVTAPDGKKIGKDFLTRQEVNEIDGAFYSGFLTDNEYLTIPNPLDGEYKIETQGTDNGGSYTIAVGYITNEALSEAEFTGETSPGLESDINFSLNKTVPESLGFVVTIQDVIDDVKMAYELDWITNRNIKKKLISELEKFNRTDEKTDDDEEESIGDEEDKADETEGHKNDINEKEIPKRIKKFLRILEKNHPKNINDQAYNLLKEDIRLLLDS